MLLATEAAATAAAERLVLVGLVLGLSAAGCSAAAPGCPSSLLSWPLLLSGSGCAKSPALLAPLLLRLLLKQGAPLRLMLLLVAMLLTEASWCAAEHTFTRARNKWWLYMALSLQFGQALPLHGGFDAMQG